jgi:GxxExxY protein
MEFDLDALEALRHRVIGCAIEVHRRLGPGLLESVYRDALVIELRAAGLKVERERCVVLKYRDEPVGNGFRMDIVVEGCLVVEVKAVERVHPVHSAQVMTYLRLSGLPCGLLINFNVTVLRSGVKKLVHPDLYGAESVRARDGQETARPDARSIE